MAVVVAVECIVEARKIPLQQAVVVRVCLHLVHQITAVQTLAVVVVGKVQRV